MCIITSKKSVKVEKEKTITKSVSLITRKNDHHWVSTDSKKSNCHYAQGEIQSGEGDVNTIGEGSMRRSLQEAEETKMLKLLYFVLTPEEVLLHQI
jgi:protease-4